MTVYPLKALRTLALHTQALTHQAKPTPKKIDQVVQQIGCVQIDTLQMVHRSQYLVLWSRFGSYDTVIFDQLMFDPAKRSLFEDWLHAACIIPLKFYRYQLPRKRRLREKPAQRTQEWLSDSDNQAVLQLVRERIRREGGLRGGDFQYDGPKRGAWWDWKPAKMALEHLYAIGELMIANRVNFQRVYDLTENVLPDWVDISEPTRDEMNRHLLESSIKSLGVCQLVQIPDYIHMKRTTAKPHLEAMLADGTLKEIQGTLYNGQPETLVLHHDNLRSLKKAATGEIRAEHTTFLSPFENLFWAKGRDVQFWNFRQILEAYKPAPIREWGYFCLPILYKDQLVGRFDPKLERKTGTLYLRALYLEPDIAPDEEMIAAIATAMRDFMNFHEATDLIIEKSHPAEFGSKLSRRI